MTSRQSPLRAPGAVAGALGLVALLTGCAGSSSTSTVAAAAGTTAAPIAAPSGAAGAAGGAADPEVAKIQSCLKAAGITVSEPPGPPGGQAGGPGGAPPSGAPGTPPSGAPGTPPSGAPGTPPSAGAGQGAGPDGQPSDPLGAPEVRAALIACGIAVPSTGARPSGTPSS